MILDCDITILLTVRNETFRELAKKQYFMVRLTIGVDLPPPLMVSLTTKYVFLWVSLQIWRQFILCFILL